MKPLTLEQAKKLRYGVELHHVRYINADGTPQRWRVNGAVKTWKLSPERVQVPIKRGMYEHSYITQNNLMEFCLPEYE